MALERLQKVLARAGLAARRKAELLITAGRVRVDGVVVSELGAKVDARRQKVEVDGRRIQAERACYGVLHKPRGMVTTVSDPEGRPTAQDILAQVGVRVVPVGRLDFNTSGALLFTNDGDFAQGLAHARSSVPKVYAAKVQKLVTEEDLERFRESIDIDGKQTRPADVRILRREGDKTWLEITLREGKNRQVRRLGDHAGTPVVRLSRLSHAGIDTVGLKPGQWRLLSATELRELKQKYGVPKKIHEQTAASEETPRRGGAGPRTGGKRPSSGERGPGERGQAVRSRPGRGSKDFESPERGMSTRGRAPTERGASRGSKSEQRSAHGPDAARDSSGRGRSAARESLPKGRGSPQEFSPRGRGGAAASSPRGRGPGREDRRATDGGPSQRASGAQRAGGRERVGGPAGAGERGRPERRGSAASTSRGARPPERPSRRR